MAIRIIFPAVASSISKSVDKRRKWPSQEKVHSTTYRFGRTARIPSIFSELEIGNVIPSLVEVNSTAVPR